MQYVFVQIPNSRIIHIAANNIHRCRQPFKGNIEKLKTFPQWKKTSSFLFALIYFIQTYCVVGIHLYMHLDKL